MYYVFFILIELVTSQSEKFNLLIIYIFKIYSVIAMQLIIYYETKMLKRTGFML